MLLRDGDVVAVGPPAALIAEHAGRPRLEIALRDPTAVRPGDAPTGDDPPAVDAGISAAVTGAVDGAAVESTTDGLRILGIDPVEIGSVVDALAAVGVGFDSLRWAQPSLEDVYLRLTGETYSPRSATDLTDTERRADGGKTADGRTPADDGSHSDSGSPTDDAGRPYSSSRGDGGVR